MDRMSISLLTGCECVLPRGPGTARGAMLQSMMDRMSITLLTGCECVLPRGPGTARGVMLQSIMDRMSITLLTGCECVLPRGPGTARGVMLQSMMDRMSITLLFAGLFFFHSDHTIFQLACIVFSDSLDMTPIQHCLARLRFVCNPHQPFSLGASTLPSGRQWLRAAGGA